MTDDERRLLLGGEISFWTNDYCPSFQCGKNTRSHPQPPAYWMSDPGHDNVFSQSVGGMVSRNDSHHCLYCFILLYVLRYGQEE
jgi:hypothetical protein